MVHKNPANQDAEPEVKQVEFNTIASSFGGLSAKVSALHRYVLTHRLPFAILMITQGTSFPSPPTHPPLHSSLAPRSLPTHPSYQYPVASPRLIKRMVALKTSLRYLFAPSSSFKMPKTMHSTNMLWLPIFSQTTISLPSAFLSLSFSPTQVYHRIPFYAL